MKKKERSVLALLLLGPMLLSLNFLVHSAYPAIPAIFLFLFLSIRYGSKGLFWGSLFTLGYSVLAITLSANPLYEGVWYASMMLSLLITALSFENGLEQFAEDEIDRIS